VLAELPAEYTGSELPVQEAIMGVVRQTLSPELLNRIDELVVFNRLQREHMDAIATIGLKDVADRLKEGQEMELVVSDHAKSVIAEMGYDPRYGARPLKRVLARELLNPLSRLVLEQAVAAGQRVEVCTRGEAQIMQKNGERKADLGWISRDEASSDKNDVVILRNQRSLHDTLDAKSPEVV
jgi:ATP-dependent Clp protease ATP-binding subunit ClpA